jgi:hypothetical protein
MRERNLTTSILSDLKNFFSKPRNAMNAATAEEVHAKKKAEEVHFL